MAKHLDARKVEEHLTRMNVIIMSGRSEKASNVYVCDEHVQGRTIDSGRECQAKRRRIMRGAMKTLTKEMGEDIEGETNWARTNSLGNDDQTARNIVG